MKNKRTNISKFYCETLSSTVLYKVFQLTQMRKFFRIQHTEELSLVQPNMFSVSVNAMSSTSADMKRGPCSCASAKGTQLIRRTYCIQITHTKVPKCLLIYPNRVHVLTFKSFLALITHGYQSLKYNIDINTKTLHAL